MPSEIPLRQNKHYSTASVFSPANLLREARRQKGLAPGRVPAVCVLDPDGDILAYLIRRKWAKPDPFWACYHTTLYRFPLPGIRLGIIACAVGGPFAVLLAEQLFVSGCRLLIEITSAGQILPVRTPPYFVLIERALRDEGTSHHYLPPARYARLDPGLGAKLRRGLQGFAPAVERGASWTTDAPYRETAEAIEAARAEGILAVEMEAASLYAFAQARRKPVVCFAHVTNQMARVEGDFEKGEADGSVQSLRLIAAVARCLRPSSKRRSGPAAKSVSSARKKLSQTNRKSYP